MQLTLKTPPTQEPISLEEFKAYLRIETHDEEALLKTLLISARSHVENLTGRALLRQQWECVMKPPYPLYSPLVRRQEKRLEITVPRPPLIEITSVHSFQKEVIYSFEGDTLCLPSSLWEKEISILYWAGYGESPESLPADLKLAVLIAGCNLYENQKQDISLLNPYKVHHLH